MTASYAAPAAATQRYNYIFPAQVVFSITAVVFGARANGLRVNMKDDDVEFLEEDALLASTGSKAPTVPDEGGIMQTAPKADMKEAAFWLSMLFIASIVMTVGNKVC